MRNIFNLLSLKILSLVLLLTYVCNVKAQTTESTEIKYYRSIFPEENGKIKSIGGTQIEYYRSIFPEENGKLKSITGKTGSDFNFSPTEL